MATDEKPQHFYDAAVLHALRSIALAGKQTRVKCLARGARYSPRRDETTFSLLGVVKGNQVGRLGGRPESIIELVIVDADDYERARLEAK